MSMNIPFNWQWQASHFLVFEEEADTSIIKSESKLPLLYFPSCIVKRLKDLKVPVLLQKTGSGRRGLLYRRSTAYSKHTHTLCCTLQLFLAMRELWLSEQYWTEGWLANGWVKNKCGNDEGMRTVKEEEGRMKAVVFMTKKKEPLKSPNVALFVCRYRQQ